MSRLFAPLSLTISVALLSGFARFSEFLDSSPLWLDLLFVISMGMTVAFGVLILSLHMSRTAKEHARHQHERERSRSANETRNSE